MNRNVQNFSSTLSTILLFAIAIYTNNDAVAQSSDEAARPNFLILIGDDMAVETVPFYDVGETPAVTPNLSRLAASGLRLDNFWAQPVCSPTRATIMTGRFGFRNGVGVPATNGNPGLRADAFTFPMALKAAGQSSGEDRDRYQLAAFGKWHLGDANNDDINHANIVGFDHFSGGLRGGVPDYHAWQKVANGNDLGEQSAYATTDVVDDAVAWLETNGTDTPWLVWIAFNAPHDPFHLPPVELLHSDTRNLDPDGMTDENVHAYYNAMIEAMDSEIGRLLGSLSSQERDNTYVIFFGDNGTPREVTRAPFERGRSKGGLYQGGINTPFIVSGPGIDAGRTSVALANSADLFATILDLAGVDMATAAPDDRVYDAVSLAPIFRNEQQQVRDFAYADVFGQRARGLVNDKAIRNERYKLHTTREREELFDLVVDPYERANLLDGELSDDARRNFEALKNRLEMLLASEASS